MDPLLLPISVAVVLGGAIGTMAVILRTPATLLNLRTRLSEAEHSIALLDAQLKKAVRRWGVEERTARKKTRAAGELDLDPGELAEPLDLPPNQAAGGAGAGLDGLSAVRLQIQRMRGSGG